MSMNTDQKIIKNKVGLLNLADMLGSVSEACKVMGYSRDSFTGSRSCKERAGNLLQRKTSGGRRGWKNGTRRKKKQPMVEWAMKQPPLEQDRRSVGKGKRG